MEFKDLAVGDFFKKRDEEIQRLYRKLTGTMACALLTGHRFFFVSAEPVEQVDSEIVIADAAAIARGFGVDMETAVSVTEYLVALGDEIDGRDSKTNQVEFFNLLAPF